MLSSTLRDERGEPYRQKRTDPLFFSACIKSIWKTIDCQDRLGTNKRAHQTTQSETASREAVFRTDGPAFDALVCCTPRTLPPPPLQCTTADQPSARPHGQASPATSYVYKCTYIYICIHIYIEESASKTSRCEHLICRSNKRRDFSKPTETKDRGDCSICTEVFV